MRTTIDLPDELLRQVKARAALDGLKLKDLIARYVAQGLRQGAQSPAGDASTVRRRSALPVIPKAAGGRVPALSNAEMQAILDEEDAERVHGSAGR